MGAVSYGQGGYVGTSMSVRAQEAYESGEMPMSKWTRGAIISAIKDYCSDFDLAYNREIESMSRAKRAETYPEYKSWHHAGRFARETEFFGLNEDAVCADFPEMTPDQIAERNDTITALKTAEAEQVQFEGARGGFLEALRMRSCQRSRLRGVSPGEMHAVSGEAQQARDDRL